mmetsp:Transcript_126838/g.364817  ORF Transcript_126838/g.364817 Transcript_126838/m.364817 type:complete len:98 (+) Transcript_126838:638-931(+)
MSNIVTPSACAVGGVVQVGLVGRASPPESANEIETQRGIPPSTARGATTRWLRGVRVTCMINGALVGRRRRLWRRWDFSVVAVGVSCPLSGRTLLLL